MDGKTGLRYSLSLSEKRRKKRSPERGEHSHLAQRARAAASETAEQARAVLVDARRRKSRRSICAPSQAVRPLRSANRAGGSYGASSTSMDSGARKDEYAECRDTASP